MLDTIELRVFIYLALYRNDIPFSLYTLTFIKDFKISLQKIAIIMMAKYQSNLDLQIVIKNF